MATQFHTNQKRDFFGRKREDFVNLRGHADNRRD